MGSATVAAQLTRLQIQTNSTVAESGAVSMEQFWERMDFGVVGFPADFADHNFLLITKSNFI